MQRMDLVPDIDYASAAAAAFARPDEPENLGEHLSDAWAAVYRSQIPQCVLLEFDSDGARFLFDLASEAGASQADRTVAAWGRSRRAPRPRDVSYQRVYPSPYGRAARPLDKGHMVAHAAGGTFGPNMFPQDRALNRGWSTEGRRYRALEREIAKTPGTFFFSCLLYADDTDFPAAIELGVLRPDGLHVERFRNRFDV
jgi:hypothetical protein